MYNNPEDPSAASKMLQFIFTLRCVWGLSTPSKNTSTHIPHRHPFRLRGENSGQYDCSATPGITANVLTRRLAPLQAYAKSLVITLHTFTPWFHWIFYTCWCLSLSLSLCLRRCLQAFFQPLLINYSKLCMCVLGVRLYAMQIYNFNIFIENKRTSKRAKDSIKWNDNSYETE